jgi:hypothetical protein
MGGTMVGKIQLWAKDRQKDFPANAPNAIQLYKQMLLLQGISRPHQSPQLEFGPRLEFVRKLHTTTNTGSS